MSALCCILIPRMLLTLRCLRNTLLSRRLMDEPVFRVFVFLARHSVPVGVPPPASLGPFLFWMRSEFSLLLFQVSQGEEKKESVKLNFFHFLYFYHTQYNV